MHDDEPHLDPDKKNVHERIADQLCAYIGSKEELPWRRDWALKPQRDATNLTTGIPYRGANAFILAIVQNLRGWESSHWLTIPQMRQVKPAPPEDDSSKKQYPHVCKGESACPIYRRIFRDPDTSRFFTSNSFQAVQKRMEWLGRKDSTIDYSDEAIRELLKRLRPSWRAANVFNPAQCANLAHHPRLVEEREANAAALAAAVENRQNWEEGLADRITEFEQRIQAEMCPIEHGSNRAAYSPTKDIIYMPDREAFGDLRAYALNLAHEAVHATGTKDRLNRRQGSRGTDAYAQEELVAEMGAWFTVYSLDLFQDPVTDNDPIHSEVMAGCLTNSQAYLRGWMSRIQDSPRILKPAITAAMRASRALSEGLNKTVQEFRQEMEDLGIDLDTIRSIETEAAEEKVGQSSGIKF